MLRIGGTANWRMTPRATLTAIVSAFGSGDVANTSDSHNAQTNVRLSYLLGPRGKPLRKAQGQVFVAYTYWYDHTKDLLFGFQNLTKNQALNVGATVTFF